MSYFDQSNKFPTTPLKHMCLINPETLPETTGADFEFSYIDIGSVFHVAGVVSREKFSLEKAPSRARKPVRTGDVIISTVRTYLRAIAKIKGEDDGAIVSTGFAVCRASEETDPGFLHAVLQSLPFIEWVVASSTGVSYPAINPSTLGDICIPKPDLHTQKRIAAFLDRETARIDDLIAKKERLLQGFGPRLEALVAEALTNRSLPQMRFELISQAIARPCNLSEHDGLVRLGLYNRGRGIFKKPAADEEGMGDSTFFFVDDGDLILSGQFAWEGAVAMAGADEAGCVVSHRYPVYRGKGVKTSYLLAFFRSRYGDFVLNDASRGAAGRNRPLNTWRLGKEKIPVPSEGLQEKIEQTISAEARLRAVHSASIDGLREYRAALITAAVTGQIDVDTYGKAGATSATLDKIEERAQA